MEFGLLGPLVVRHRGEDIAVRAGRPRSVLITLLLRPGQAVSSDGLIDNVWGDRLPADPANALQVVISYLRRTLPFAATGQSLRTVGGGYALDVDPDDIDIHRFDRRLAAATVALSPPVSATAAASALDDLRRAGDLWRGEPLLDVAFEPFAAAEIARLGELRITAFEREAEALLVLGRNREAIALLRPVITDHPAREYPRSQLMLALYREGRQVEALAEFESLRCHLRDELGVDAGAHVSRLHLAILQQRSDLDWEPPSADSDEPATTSLPTALTPLVGRRHEVATVAAALGDSRLVTLVGPGGVGKSRVALAVGHTLVAVQPAVWMADLAHVTTADGVGRQIADAAGVVTHGDHVDATALRIGQKPCVLLLDTCEHLVGEAADAVTRLLAACPNLSVLVTSRQPLAVAGETVIQIPPMIVPGTAASLDQIAASEAIALFRQRARAARRDFELDATNARGVARICSALDGLPLAIELAAARCNALTIDAIVELLDDRFAVAQIRPGSGDRRQRSLEATIEWSYQLLDDDQRRCFRRLAVFDGEFGLDLAAAVVGDGAPASAVEPLSAMVERSLVLHDGRGRYRLLDSLRDYARKQLAEHPHDDHAAHAALARWLDGRCADLEGQLRTRDQARAYEELHALAAHVRVAMDWALANHDEAVGARLAASISWQWALEANNDEAVRWLQRASGAAGLTDDDRARVLENLGMHQLVTGNVAEADDSLKAAIALWRAPGDGALARVYAGLAVSWFGDVATAAALQDEAIAIADANGDHWMRAWARAWRARTASAAGDDADADALLAEAAETATTVGDPRSLGWITSERATVAVRRGDHDEALALADIAVDAQRRSGWAEGAVAAIASRSRALVALGRPREALVELAGALQTAAELSQPYVAAATLERTVDALLADGQPGLAGVVHGHCDEVIAALGLSDVLARHRRRVEAVAGRIGASIGPAELERHAAVGRALPLTDVIARVEAVVTGG